MTTEMTNF